MLQNTFELAVIVPQTMCLRMDRDFVFCLLDMPFIQFYGHSKSLIRVSKRP